MFRPLYSMVLGLACACGAHAHEGTDSAAVCEQGEQLDYESFGRDFMQRYCATCHSSELPAAERNGAPSDHDFDSLDGVHAASLEHVDHVAAAGPNSVNEEMPPAGSLQPTLEERETLGRWLACGAP